MLKGVWTCEAPSKCSSVSSVQSWSYIFSDVCPVLHTFRQQVVDECQKQGYLRTIGGRRRLFPNIYSSDLVIRSHTERQAINFVIQGMQCTAFVLYSVYIKLSKIFGFHGGEVSSHVFWVVTSDKIQRPELHTQCPSAPKWLSQWGHKKDPPVNQFHCAS
jgi:hypothetical protein